MLLILIKKQFKECFRNYFIDSKTGQAKSKKAIIGMFVLFAFLLLILGVSFFGLATTLYDLLNTQYRWLYYGLFVIMMVSLGTFASVFNTSSSLYNAKDNDLLLSMPIKPSYILLSRIVLVYGLSMLYSALVWIPICIYAFLAYKFSVISLILDILLLFVINVFTSVLTCFLGYIVANISRKTKNKAIVTSLLSLLFIGVYYLICFKLQNILNLILLNQEKVADIFSTWGYLIYQTALAADGNVLSFVIITIIDGVLAFICYKVLSNSYSKIITSSKNVQSKSTKLKYTNSNNVDKTLLIKEFKRFVNTPIYLLNCGLGCLFVLIAGVAMLIKKNDVLLVIESISTFIPEVNSFLPLIVIGIIVLIISLNNAAIPSISLEGKQLWILKSLPVDTYKILNAKKILQVLINLIPSVISALLISYVFKLELQIVLFIIIIIYFYEEIHACSGLLLGLINPNFIWTNETQPVKQDLMVLAGMVVSLLIGALIIVPYYFFRNTLPINEYLDVLIIVMALIIVLLRKLIRIWGVRKFESL